MCTVPVDHIHAFVLDFCVCVTRFRHRIVLEGPAIGAGGHRMGLISTTRNLHQILYKKLNQEDKTTIFTSLLVTIAYTALAHSVTR